VGEYTSQTQAMRKIEAQTIQAVRTLANRADFNGRLLKSGNMEVWQTHLGIAGTVNYDRIIQVKLHGNIIATFYPATDTFTVSDAGWQTTTTKSRINALLSVFSPAAGRVYAKAFDWYFGESDWSGEVTLPVDYRFDSWQARQAEKLAGYHG
jgi:hypothetical protein